MPQTRRRTAVFCLSLVLASASGCMNDDDLTTKVAAEDQAEAVIPLLVATTFGTLREVGTIVRAAAEAPSSVADATAEDECSPIHSFCSDPLTGVICPADAMVSVCRFSDCHRNWVSWTLDGTVTIQGSGPHALAFDLEFDRTYRISGQARITLGESCATMDLVELASETPKFSSTAVGQLQDCPSAQSGSIQALVSATGFRPTVFEMTLDSDGGSVIVIDVATRERLYLCRWRRWVDLGNGEPPPHPECSPYGA